MPEVDINVSSQGIQTLQAQVDQLIASFERLQAVSSRSGGVAGAADDLSFVFSAARSEARRGVAGQGIAELQERYQGSLEQVRAQAFPSPVSSRRQEARQVLADVGDAFAQQKILEDEQRVQQRQEQTEARSRLSTLRTESLTTRRVASLINRGANPLDDPYVAEQLARQVGSSEPAAINQRLQEVRQQASDLRLLTAGGAEGSTLRSLALVGVGANASRLASSVAQASGAGEEVRANEHLGSLLGSAAGLAALAIPGVGLPAAIAISAGAGALGNLSDTYFQNRRQLRENEFQTAAVSGLSFEQTQRFAQQVGRTGDPTNIGIIPHGGRGFDSSFDWGARPFGEAEGRKAFEATQGLEAAGFTPEQRAQAASQALRQFNTAAPEAIKALVPLEQDPFFRDRIEAARQASGRTATGSRGDEVNAPALSPSFAAEGVLRHGLQETLSAINAALPGEANEAQRNALHQSAVAFSDITQRQEVNTSIASSGSSIAGSQLTGFLAQGGAIDSAGGHQAAQAVIAARQQEIAAVEAQIQTTRGLDQSQKDVQDALKKQQAQLASLTAGLQTFEQQVHAQAVALGTQRIATQGTIAGAAFQAGQFGLAPGTINPAQAETERVSRAALADANRRANDPLLTPEQRLAAQGQAAQLRNVIDIEQPRQRLFAQFGAPAQAAQSFTARQLVDAGQAAQFGTLGEAGAAFSTAESAQGRNIGRQQELLTQLEAAYGRGQATFQEVDQQRSAVQAAQVQLRQIQRGRVEATAGRRLLESEGETGRFGAQLSQAERFGATEETLGGFLGRDITNRQETLQRSREELAALTRVGITPEERQNRLSRINQEELGLQEAQRAQALLPAQAQIRRAGLASSVTEAGAAYGQSLGLGPDADLQFTARRVEALQGQQQSLLQRAALGLNPQQDEADRAAAAVLGFQAQGTRLEGLSTYRPSSRDALRLGRLSLAEDLAENDPFTGGQVPIGLRRERASLLNQQVGGIEARIAQAPEGPERDAVAAALEPQRANLLQQLQQERNASQFGDIGHLLNISSGTNGDFWWQGPSVREFQRFNPGGTRSLGGSGESVGLSPFAEEALNGGGAMQTPARLLGGTNGGMQTSGDLLSRALTSSGAPSEFPSGASPEGPAASGLLSDSGLSALLGKLDELIAATRQGSSGAARTTSGPGFGPRDLDQDPREQARRAAFGNR